MIQYFLECQLRIESFRSSDLTEVGTLSNPPQSFYLVFQAVGVLFEPSNKEFQWKDARRLVSGSSNSFLKKIDQFNIDQITDDQINRLSTILQCNECNPQIVHQFSRVTAEICQWIHAVYHYSIFQRQSSLTHPLS